MRFPLNQAANMATYIAKNKLRPRPEWQENRADDDSANPFKIIHTQIPSMKSERKPHPMINKRFPLVMMLEPLHACNLTCTGCGRIREYEETIRERVSLEDCLKAVDECGAPMVSICGGEPLLLPDIGVMCAEILKRGRYIQLCTNGMFLRKRLKDFTPHPGLVFNVHLDGLEKTHDMAVEREGVFQQAIDGIKAAKEAGFKVFSNTTVFKETDMNEIWQLFEFLEQFRVDGHAISPGYGYSAVNDREMFLTREDVHEKFAGIEELSKRFRNPKLVRDLGRLHINISGCINACGHHHVGHIGILGVEKNGEEFYQITLGGRADEHAQLGTLIGPAVPYAEVADVVEDIVAAYLELREQPDEIFLDTVQRVGIEPFKERVYATR